MFLLRLTLPLDMTFSLSSYVCRFKPKSIKSIFISNLRSYVCMIIREILCWIKQFVSGIQYAHNGTIKNFRRLTTHLITCNQTLHFLKNILTWNFAKQLGYTGQAKKDYHDLILRTSANAKGVFWQIPRPTFCWYKKKYLSSSLTV
jgi:hypothetical protein